MRNDIIFFGTERMELCIDRCGDVIGAGFCRLDELVSLAG